MVTWESYLTTIANAIREKKGTTELIKAKNFANEILSIQGGGSLNVAYSLTPPTDTSKIWLQCAEPSGVEVQNYLGECAVSEVANYGGIDNPTTFSSFHTDYFNSCYIGNNQIAIVGYNHIRIYDLTSKKYITDYTISVGTGSSYTNVLFKDNVLYFGYVNILYSFDLTTQTLTAIVTLSSSNYKYKYIFFNSENEIDAIIYDSDMYYGRRYRYNLIDKTNTAIKSSITPYQYFQYIYSIQDIVKANNSIYHFRYASSNGSYYCFKLDLLNNTIATLTSFSNFITNTLGTTTFEYTSVVVDSEERYIYIIGGGNSTIGYRNIIKYDTINDTFELLDTKLINGKYKAFSVLVDNRIYIFGGSTDSTNNTYGRTNLIDYFDISYPLNQNNAILTINNKTDKYLPLINTEKLKINSNIASAYIGNADNLAEKVNAYHHNGYGWVGINCDDYEIYFSWLTIPNETINSALVIDLSTYYTTNAKDVALSVSSTNATAFEVTLSGTELTITPLEVSQTTTITVTATVNSVEYQTTFSVTSADIITSA